MRNDVSIFEFCDIVLEEQLLGVNWGEGERKVEMAVFEYVVDMLQKANC